MNLQALFKRDGESRWLVVGMPLPLALTGKPSQQHLGQCLGSVYHLRCSVMRDSLALRSPPVVSKNSEIFFDVRFWFGFLSFSIGSRFTQSRLPK